MKAKPCLVLFFAVLLWLFAQGAEALVLQDSKGKEGPISLAGEVEIFRDAPGNITIEDILSAGSGIKFIPRDVRYLQKHSDDVFWIRFSLQQEPGAASDWVVQIFPTWVDDVRVYSQDPAGKISLHQLGDRHPFASRAIQTSVLAFPVALDSSPRTYYLRIKTHGPTVFDLNAWQKSTLERSEINRTIFFSAFAGAICVMVLMNLIFWVWLRSSIYPIYALFLVAMLVAIVAMQGYSSSLFFPDDPLRADRFVDVTSCALMSIAAVFACRFFNYGQYSVWAARFMYLAAAAFAAMIPFSLWWGIGNIIQPAVYLEIVVALFNLAFVVWIVVGRGARQYLLAAVVFGVVDLSWIFFSLVLLGYVQVDQSFILETLIPFSQLANLALLNFAVASRSRQAELKLRAQRKRAFDSMKVAKQALEERVRQREFVAIVSHEFRTPLAIVDAVAHALELSPSGQDDRVKRSVGKIRKAIRRLAALIENILLDDALEVGSRPVARSFDLWDVIGNIRSIGLPEDNARLTISVARGQAMCRGDQARIEMAIRNLVQNALKYSPADSAVDVRCDTSADSFSVTVSNKGAPIPEFERSGLFERYFRGATSANVPGSGLGLHISRTIAQQHGGDVTLVASDGEGTVFCLTLPLDLGHQDQEAPHAASFEAPALKV
jgi:signal transduction histidine kinase